MTNYKKDLNDFNKEFQMNIQSLQSSCANYDAGKDFAVIEMATRLRVLLHDTKRNVSLFKHLDLKGIDFVNTAFDIDENNMLSDECLVYISPDENFEFMKYYPNLNASEKSLISFDEWWNQIVYRDSEKRFSRADIVLQISDKDGGAHSDPKLSGNYYDFSRKGSGATTFFSVDGQQVSESQSMDNLHYASLRQIAYEVLESLKLV